MKLISYFQNRLNLFYILPLSLEILLNLCFLSSKQETAGQILTSRRSQVTKVVFFFHYYNIII